MTERAMLLAAALFAFAHAGPAWAQETEAAGAPAPQRPVWVNAGLVGDVSGDHLGFGGSVNFMTARDHIVTVRAMYLEEFQLCIFGGCGEPTTRNELGVLYGIASATRWVGASVAAGLGVIGGRRTDPNAATLDTEGFITVGVPMEAQVYLRPFRAVGIGATALVNVNSVETLAGLMFAVQLGRLSPPAAR